MNTEEKPRSSAPDMNAMELETLRYWNEQGIYQKSLEKNAGKEPYIFYDGPPFATGLPHYGHMLASTIKDVMPRYQTMRGKYVRRRWGWDCHGLPIENIVEKKLNISGKRQIEELGVDVFNAACRDNVLTFASDWGKMVERMGRWVDFENSYKTMDTSYQESVWWALQQLWNKQLIYEDRKVLLYCSRCETPMSNFEIAMDNSYRDVTENSVYVQFKLQPRQRILDWISNDQTYVLAWTTTPWTLPGNTALHVGPDLPYVLVQYKDAFFILTKERLDLFEGPVEVVREFSAQSLAGLFYEPLYPGVVTGVHEPVREGDPSKAHRVYVDSFVQTTEGTGVVHSAVMYGEEDFLAAKEHDLPRVPMLDAKGQYLSIAPEFLRGMFFKDAEKPVLDDLAARGLVFRVQPYTHSYPHCWRCGTPLFYNALPAWLVNVQKMKPDMLRTAEAVEWYPAHLKDGRVKNSMSQAPDWNISRNRFWATALPFWRCQAAGCGKVECVGSVAELREKAINFEEVYPNFQFPISNFQTNSNAQIPKEALERLDLHKPYIDRVLLKCTACEGQMKRVPEVVDCWVESASMPFAELHYPFENTGTASPEDLKNRFPADFVAEYIAQTRAWFYVMHVMGTALFDRAPFKHVVTTGTILAEDGSKMSKSKNNFPDPWVLIEKYGVDAVRFYLMQSPVMNGDDFNFSEVGVKEVSQKVNMLLHNVWSFYRMYSAEKLTANSLQLTTSHVLDKWVLARLDALIAEVTAQLDAYNTMKACRAIVEFINDLSTWYVRRSRDRIKAGGADAELALQTLGFVLARTCQVLAPISPFIADRIYTDITGEESVHLSEWPSVVASNELRVTSNASDQQRILEQMELVREIVSLALAARKAAAVSVRQPLRAMAYQLRGQELQLSAEHWAIIQEELNVKQIEEYESLADAASRESGIVKQESLGPVAAVLLDTVLTPELQQEGYARELERAIQDLRKKSGLRVGEFVNVYYTITDSSMEAVLLERVDRKKTFIASIVHELEVEPDNEMQLELGGIPVWLGMVKQTEGQ